MNVAIGRTTIEADGPTHLVEIQSSIAGFGKHPRRSGLAQSPGTTEHTRATLLGLDSTGPFQDPSSESTHTRFLEFRALGTSIHLWLSPNEPIASSSLDWVQPHVLEFEQALSRFLPDSELTRLNSQAGHGPQKVSSLLLEVTQSALRLAQESRGLVDPTTLSSLVREGYGPGPTHGRPAYADVSLNERQGTIELGSDVALDFGGVAKGWLADRLADRLVALGSVLVDIGGDMRALGVDSWIVEVEDPFRPDRHLAELNLRDRGVATSSTLKRSWGQGKHHLIDPRTGRCAETDLVAATVVCPTACQAEGEAKTALLLGRIGGLEWLRGRGLAGVLVDRDAKIWKVGC